jgi:hypothetical protein
MAFNIYLVIFIIVAIVVTAAGCYLLYSLDGSTFGIISAVIFFIGALVLFCMYGVRWFDSSRSKSVFSNSPDDWITGVNTCPDYLSYIDGKGCVDISGVADKKDFMKYDANNDKCKNNDSICVFSVVTNSTEDSKNTLCKNAMGNHLTWEGITDGEHCTFPVNSDGSSSSSNNGGKC